ncbi:hypothetical protein NLJ89_g6548 [Agrocybe chaxingu]|uniref:Uncharacterized protein n=1 Tax=Agrocybe chaxingu TaxID=84603 RepID=A0A9W8JW97_9AGAR|nr:hypothetical protein NLJ89_g6548 [Agrocybe chaxingu]
MPPRTKRTKREPDVVCKCRSHCTIYNAQTGQYEGDGEVVSRRTRDNHSADDKKRATRSLHLVTRRQPPSNEVPSEWVKLINDEVNVLMELPLTSPSQPLVFSNNPSETGPFGWPNDQEILLPNYGRHALTGHRSNHAILSTEQRLAELYTFLQLQGFGDAVEGVDLLTDRLLEGLKVITRAKEVEWAGQRGRTANDAVYVNSGTFIYARV